MGLLLPAVSIMEVKLHSALGIKRRVPESSVCVTKGFFFACCLKLDQD